MNEYTVKYTAGPYSGTRKVHAEDGQEAINKVRDWVRREMTLPMYSDNYRLQNSDDDIDDET